VSVLLSCSSVGVPDQEVQKEISIYPNPSQGIFTMDFKNNTFESVISIYDVLGNCVLNKASGNDTHLNFNLSNQTKGIYFMKLQTKEKVVTQKILVQ
jgi:hypothetical protein